MLSQSDFRKLLEKGREEKPEKSKTPAPEPTKADIKKRKEKRKRSYQEYLAKKEKKKAEEGPKYRDRALERQRGKLLDYAGTEEVLKNISVEHSKFLGGDEAHTHLVKGLDFALLERKRAEIDAQKAKLKAEREKLRVSSASTAAKHGGREAAGASSSAAPEDKQQEEAPPAFNTTMGLAVYNIMSNRAKLAASKEPNRRSPFAIGHMSFEYPLDPTKETLPTKVLHSKIEDASQERVTHYEVPQALFEQIERFSLKRRGMKKKKKKKKRKHSDQSTGPSPTSPTSSASSSSSSSSSASTTSAPAPVSVGFKMPKAPPKLLDPELDMFS